jgi:hypothetical protein
MAVGARGDQVTFALSGVTTVGVVIGVPTTTSNLVAYDFGVPNASRIDWAGESLTTSVTVLTGSTSHT